MLGQCQPKCVGAKTHCEDLLLAKAWWLIVTSIRTHSRLLYGVLPHSRCWRVVVVLIACSVLTVRSGAWQVATAHPRPSRQICLEWTTQEGVNAEFLHTRENLEILGSNQKQMQKGRREYEQALKAYRQLAQGDPETYLPYIALMLSKLGILDSDQNRIEAARNEYEEALEMYRELVQKDSRTYLPLLSATLNNLGMLDHDRHRIEEALKTYRELAQKNPEIFLPHVALTINNLGILDSDQRETKKAWQEYQQALKMYIGLAEKNPEIYLLHIAMTLNNLGVLDSEENRTQEARREYEEALKIYESFAKQDSIRFSPDVERVKKLLKGLHR